MSGNTSELRDIVMQVGEAANSILVLNQAEDEESEEDVQVEDSFEFVEISRPLIEVFQKLQVKSTGGVTEQKSEKNSLIKALKQHYGQRILISAPTGVAVFNVGGETVHSLLHFTGFSMPKIKNLKTLSMLTTEFANIACLVIDAYLMLMQESYRFLMPGYDLPSKLKKILAESK
ncbi:MAG: hypothetical protein MHMPM18_001388 [Marteilia pararefringens]